MTKTIERPRQKQNRAAGQQSSAALRERVRKLLQTEIDFIPNAEFRAATSPSDELLEATLDDSGPSNVPADLPAHLRRMCEAGLLSRDQEVVLFREMNLLKFRANALRSRLDPDSPDTRHVEKIESLLAQAQTIRDHIIKANMRLVMSIVKKFVTPQQSFDDLMSDGILTLMQAVEKFDYDRGFRFSTYAYRSIARNAYRTVMAARKEEARFTRDAENWAFEEEGGRSSSMTDQIWTKLRERTAAMLKQLDRRERFIIRSRYALGSHRKVRTFQYLADKLGVSKERVRQLEQRAVGKLKSMAGEIEIDELFGASMV